MFHCSVIMHCFRKKKRGKEQNAIYKLRSDLLILTFQSSFMHPFSVFAARFACEQITSVCMSPRTSVARGGGGGGGHGGNCPDKYVIYPLTNKRKTGKGEHFRLARNHLKKFSSF